MAQPVVTGRPAEPINRVPWHSVAPQHEDGKSEVEASLRVVRSTVHGKRQVRQCSLLHRCLDRIVTHCAAVCSRLLVWMFWSWLVKRRERCKVFVKANPWHSCAVERGEVTQQNTVAKKRLQQLAAES